MKNIILIIAGVLGGIILFQYLFYSCEGRKRDKEISTLRDQLNQCLTSPVNIDTVVVSTVLRDTIRLSYTHKVIDTVHVSDAVNWQDSTIQTRQYNGTYSHPQFDVDWSAIVTGTLDDMTINPPSLIRSLVITKEKTVNISQPAEPERERSHLYADLGGTYWHGGGGIDAGLAWIHKRGFGIRAGIGTDFEHLQYNGGIIVKLK